MRRFRVTMFSRGERHGKRERIGILVLAPGFVVCEREPGIAVRDQSHFPAVGQGDELVLHRGLLSESMIWLRSTGRVVLVRFG